MDKCLVLFILIVADAVAFDVFEDCLEPWRAWSSVLFANLVIIFATGLF